jgi:hypothetical protein
MSTETLHDCHGCGRKNFTARGIKAHVCKPDKNILPFPSMTTTTLTTTKPIDLDKTSPDQIRNSFVFDAEETGARAKAMLGHIEGLKKERAVKALLVGIYLHQVKIALPHGEFNAWCTAQLGNSKRKAELYMSLAAKFSRSAKLLLPELIGANQLSLDLANVQDEGGRAILGKLDAFVGELGLTELLRHHGVISPLGARGGSTTRGREDGEESIPAVKNDGPPDWANEVQCRLWENFSEAQRLSYREWMPRISLMNNQVNDPKKGFLPNLPQVAKDDLVTVCCELLAFLKPGVLRSSQIPTA